MLMGAAAARSCAHTACAGTTAAACAQEVCYSDQPIPVVVTDQCAAASCSSTTVNVSGRHTWGCPVCRHQSLTPMPLGCAYPARRFTCLALRPWHRCALDASASATGGVGVGGAATFAASCGWPHHDVLSLMLPCRLVECSPPDPITIHISDYRAAAGGWMRLALKNVAGDAAITAVELSRATDVLNTTAAWCVRRKSLWVGWRRPSALTHWRLPAPPPAGSPSATLLVLCGRWGLTGSACPALPSTCASATPWVNRCVRYVGPAGLCGSAPWGVGCAEWLLLLRMHTWSA
jgi:hypothetical protein